MQTFATTLGGVVSFAFLARLISTSQMGILAILSLILSLAQLIAPLALPNAITRFVAEELARGPEAERRRCHLSIHGDQRRARRNDGSGLLSFLIANLRGAFH
jgi:O-antigen/teichoic acid export membrane protein